MSDSFKISLTMSESPASLFLRTIGKKFGDRLSSVRKRLREGEGSGVHRWGSS